MDTYSPTNDITVNSRLPQQLICVRRTWIGDAADGLSYSPSDETRSSIIASANCSSASFHSGTPHYAAHLSLFEFAYTSSFRIISTFAMLIHSSRSRLSATLCYATSALPSFPIITAP
ncbi:hypothetical protein NL676_005267 [Syzygium grande]|nr:hypothetical protein NL676_005267 [Syzygium grande]